jgi:hypothetical protein
MKVKKRREERGKKVYTYTLPLPPKGLYLPIRKKAPEGRNISSPGF